VKKFLTNPSAASLVYTVFCNKKTTQPLTKRFDDSIIYPISGMKAPNRLVLAPMTNQQSHPDGTVSEEEIRFLEMRAQGEFGTVATCAMYVTDDGKAWQGQMGLSSDRFISPLRKLTQAIHRHGSLVIAQLFHGGSRANPELTGRNLWSASDIFHRSSGQLIAREAPETLIEEWITAFEQAAIRACEVGFDGVEIHAAHGYLIHQFLSAATNKRTDHWGGTPKKRMNFLLAILKRIQRHLKGKKIVGVRISPEDFSFFTGIDFDESLQTAQLLFESEVDYLDISLWNALKKPEKYPDGPHAITYFANQKVGHASLIRTAGEIYTREQAQQVLHLGADLLAIGRAAIAHHHLPELWRRDILPSLPPYSENHLAAQGLSKPFINYMKRWKNFVSETEQ
jgi:2,4-dienoyl-CoA reductase-like NADH-dependent reductase (Old Yellow Enzyme family)